MSQVKTASWLVILLLMCQLLCSASSVQAAPGLLAWAEQATTATEVVAEVDESDLSGAMEVVEPVKMGRRETLLASLTIFVLAVFLGFELITKVPPTLHTPLMSGSNAISGITLVGALFAAGMKNSGWVIPTLGVLAVVMATVNAVGGFAVTHRMLSMFRRN